MQAGEPGSPGNECAQTSATPVTAHYSLCRYGKPTASPKATGLRGATAKGVRLRRLSRRRLEQDGSAHTPDSRDHPTGRLCGGWGDVPTVGLEKWMHAGCASPSRQPHVCAHTRAHMCRYILMHAHSHAFAHMHTRARSRVNAHMHARLDLCPHAHAHTLARALAHGEKGLRGSRGRAAHPGRTRAALARHREIQAVARSVPHRPIGSALLSVPLKRPLHLDHLQSEKCNPRWHFWPHLVPQLYLEQTGAFLGPRGVRVARDGETDHRGRVLPDSHPWSN